MDGRSDRRNRTCKQNSCRGRRHPADHPPAAQRTPHLEEHIASSGVFQIDWAIRHLVSQGTLAALWLILIERKVLAGRVVVAGELAGLHGVVCCQAQGGVAHGDEVVIKIVFKTVVWEFGEAAGVGVVGAL